MLVGPSARSARLVSALVAGLALLLSGLAVTAPPASAADCTPLGDAELAFDAPTIAGEVSTEGACFQLNQGAGTILQAYLDTNDPEVSFTVTNADGVLLCDVGRRESETCQLAGAQPYQVVAPALQDYPRQYELQLRRVTDPLGCETQTPSPFGDPGGAATTVQLEAGRADCRIVDLEASPVVVGHEGEGEWTLYDADGTAICSGRVSATCDVASSGTKTLVTSDGDAYGAWSTTKSVVPLGSSTEGCGPPLSTSWSEPSATVTLSSPVQVDCRPLDASPGDRVLDETSGKWGASARSLVVDDAGDRVCERSEGYGGCVLGADGPYRIISYPANATGWTDYTLSARNLTTLEGCPTIAPSAFGTEPDDNHPGAYCRQFEVREAARFLVAPTTAAAVRPGPQVYTTDGRDVDCDGSLCALEPGHHALTILPDRDFTTAFHDLTDEDGCSAGGDSLATRLSGTALDVGHQCYILPSPSGSTIAAVRPVGQGGPWLHYFDAEGRRQCASIDPTHPAARCALEGTEPFRVLVRPGGGDYRLAFTRLDSPQGCTQLDPGAFGTLEGEELTLDADVFARCFVVPEADYTGKELFAFARSSGSDQARLFVTDTGWAELPCLTGSGARGRVDCWPNAGGPSPGGHTVVLMSDGKTASAYKVVRRQLGAKASCEPVASTRIGGPATQGTISDYLELDCYSFDAEPMDSFLVNLHTAKDTSALTAYRPDGGLVCSRNSDWCRASGHTQYQVVVGAHDGTVLGDYELEPMQVRSAAGGLPLDRCVEYVDYSTGFGPLEATLDSESSSACVVVRDVGYDRYGVDVENTAGGDSLPLLHVENMNKRVSTFSSCAGSDGAFECTGFAGAADGSYFDRGMLLFLRPDGPESVPFRAVASCASGSSCGDIFRVTDATPMTAPSDSSVTVTVSGGRLPSGEQFRLVREGHEDVVGSAVSGDEHARDVVFDLAGVSPGDWQLEVESAKYGVQTAGDFVVSEPLLESDEPAEVRGVSRVDRRVRAYEGTWTAPPDAFDYQWHLDGEDMDGATSRRLRLRPWMRGGQVSVTVTAYKDGYADEVASTAAQRLVARGAAPRIRERPRVKGIKRKGHWVRATKGAWSKEPRRYSFQWFVDGRRLGKQNGRRLFLRRWMVGHRIQAKVIAHRPGCYKGRAWSYRYRVRR